jgi:hypothetical protein
MDWSTHCDIGCFIVETSAEEERVNTSRVLEKEAPNNTDHPHYLKSPQYLQFVKKELASEEGKGNCFLLHV